MHLWLPPLGFTSSATSEHATVTTFFSQLQRFVPSRVPLTDDEMKQLLINACRQLTQLLRLKDNSPAEYERQIKAYNRRDCRSWER